MGQLKKVLFET